MLYIIATPIGNLKDITLRAVDVLKNADIVLAEDTRNSRKLLAHYQIDPGKLVSFHEHSKDRKLGWVLTELKNGKDIALVSDAGTPGIADPGQKLVGEAVIAGMSVGSIPGPSALSTILSVTGWPNEPVLYLGYLPKKKGRKTQLEQLAQLEHFVRTLVFFESPHRIIKTLNELKSALGDKQVVVGRELTKVFEDIFHGTLTESIKYFDTKQKGEFTLAVNMF